MLINNLLSMHIIDIIIFVVYFTAMLGIGVYFLRKMKTMKTTMLEADNLVPGISDYLLWPPMWVEGFQ